ncbi:MAG TPA: ABC transporter permease [Kiritimatiellae bacterium]|nr:ABC transporter permease [Kiritimatiellia bacterium]
MRTLQRVGAVALREWRSSFNSPVAYVFVVMFLILNAFFTFFVSRFYEAGQADLRPFFIWHPWIYLIFVPAVAMRTWAEERRSGTVELLFTLGITPAEAVLGKFLSAWGVIGLALLLTATIPGTAAYLGSPDWGVVLTGYLGSFLMAGTYLALGMFCSALTRSQVVSFILATVAGLFVVLIGFDPVTGILSRFLPSGVVEAVAAASILPHFEATARGVLDVRDLVYFGSTVTFLLYATTQAVNQRG